VGRARLAKLGVIVVTLVLASIAAYMFYSRLTEPSWDEWERLVREGCYGSGLALINYEGSLVKVGYVMDVVRDWREQKWVCMVWIYFLTPVKNTWGEVIGGFAVTREEFESRYLVGYLTDSTDALDTIAATELATQVQDQVEVKIEWVTYINPTHDNDYAYGTCVFGDYVAVLGQAERNPYIVLLRKSNGSVVREWIGVETGALYNCISVGGKLYAVGHFYVDYNYYGLIYVFGVNLRILAKIMSENPSGYYSLAYDGKALYIGGWIYEDVNGDGEREPVWLVEKRALDESLSLVSSKKIYFGSWREGWIYDIGVDPSTGRIWAVGWYKDFDDKIHSLIVIFDSDLRELKVIDYPRGSREYLGELTGIAFDGKYVYVSGYIGVAKFSVNGELVAINKDDRRRDKIVYDNN